MASHRQYPVMIWSSGGDRKIYPLEFAWIVTVVKSKAKERHLLAPALAFPAKVIQVRRYVKATRAK